MVPGRPLKPDIEIIDVDKTFAMKYEPAQGDLIIPLEPRQFRQEYRARMKALADHGGLTSRNRPSMPPPTSTAPSASGTSRAPSQPGRGINTPSDIGPAIADMRSKRTLAALPQHQSSSATPSEPPPAKRRKVDGTQVQTSTRTQVNATPGSSRGTQVHTAAGPSRVTAQTNAATPLLSPTGRAKSTRRKDDDDDDDGISFIGHVRTVPRTTTVQKAKPLVSNQPNSKRMRGQDDVIELSDSEDEAAKQLVPPKKKTKVAPSAVLHHQDVIEIFSDSDEHEKDDIYMQDADFERPPSPPPIPRSPTPESDWDPPGWDLNDPDRWTPIPVNQNKLYDHNDDEFLVANLEELYIAPVLPPVRKRYIPANTTKFDPPPRQRETGPPQFVWDKLKLCLNTNLQHFKPRARPVFQQLPSKPYRRPWRNDFDLYNLKSTEQFKKAPGSINRVEQKGKWTVICSGCVGGLPDVEGEELNPYNQEGSLMTYNGVLDIPKGHQAQKLNAGSEAKTKYYAVNDVKFDPIHHNSFVSSGADRKVRIWALTGEPGSDDEDPNNLPGEDVALSQPTWENLVLQTMRGVAPYDLSYRPASNSEKSFLAIAERKVHIWSISDVERRSEGAFALYPDKRPHIVGTMGWGTHSTSGHLFASSEPYDPNPVNAPSFDGAHKAYDVERRSILYQFDAAEAGDTLCLDETGERLALATRASDRHILRLYDIARREAKATTKINLEAFPVRYEGFEGEVTSAAFSPDGILLAMGRNDNQTHVYDVRHLSNGPVYRYVHTGDRKSATDTCLYGIAKVQWLHSSLTGRMALITAGEDGCVRVWDPTKPPSDKNGQVVAEVNSDIGHFSIGDPFAGEHQLIVGDCTGEVTFFGRALI